MAEDAGIRVFDHCLGCLTSPAEARLAAHLAAMPALTEAERAAIAAGTRAALLDTLHLKLTRLLVIEINIAREEARLEGDSPEARWDDFVATAATPAFWDAVFADYPALAPRLTRVIGHQLDAALAFARDWIADRDALAALIGDAPGALRQIRFAQGDRHAGGRSVVMVDTAAGPVVYKPRPLDIDVALDCFLGWVSANGAAPALRVAPVLCRGDHGWAHHVGHRYAAADDDDEIARFYHGIGEALAVMRVLAGTDLHGENLIAHGGTPVLIDCETLFTPNVTPFPTPYGQAHDRAAALIAESVLAIGLLPDRAQGLGWRGIDMSGVGGLPDQQPGAMVPGLIDAGTDRVRVALVPAITPRNANHPAETPRLAEFWPHVLVGFEALTTRLRALDAAGALEPALAGFGDCPTRVVVRPTETYAELERMLWHPVSLSDEHAAVTRARAVLADMADNFSYAPSDPAVIDAEIANLLVGDVPVFTTTPARGALTGPGGTTWLPPSDLVAAAIADWRRADDEAERHFIRAALVSAYVNDGHLVDAEPRRPVRRLEDLDRRSRTQAAILMRDLIGSAHRGADGTASWAAPILSPSGWTVQALGPDLYAGLSGVALAVGGYLRETAAGRADAVEGAEDLFDGVVATLRRWEAEQRRERIARTAVRPPPTGGFVGLGSQIWTRLALRDMRLDDDRAIADALAIAEGLRWAEDGDDRDDLLYGRAGAIPPLLRLAAASGDDAPLALARHFGAGLCKAATRDGQDRAWWTHAHFPSGIGGFAHGVSGVGWALAHLAAATGDAAFAATARAAFAFEDDLWDARLGNWRDLRGLDGVESSAAWCHGAVGVALARLDLDPDLAHRETVVTLDRAVAAMVAVGSGWNHCLCHGDFGAWDLFDHAIRADRAPAGMDHSTLRADLVGGLEENGAICGVTRAALTPGLFTGISGILYQLLRMHPEARLPSPLVLA